MNRFLPSALWAPAECTWLHAVYRSSGLSAPDQCASDLLHEQDAVWTLSLLFPCRTFCELLSLNHLHCAEIPESSEVGSDFCANARGDVDKVDRVVALLDRGERRVWWKVSTEIPVCIFWIIFLHKCCTVQMYSLMTCAFFFFFFLSRLSRTIYAHLDHLSAQIGRLLIPPIYSTTGAHFTWHPRKIPDSWISSIPEMLEFLNPCSLFTIKFNIVHYAQAILFYKTWKDSTGSLIWVQVWMFPSDWKIRLKAHAGVPAFGFMS